MDCIEETLAFNDDSHGIFSPTIRCRVGASVLPQFDVFRIETDGQVHWIKAAVSLESAKALIEVLGQTLPGDYIIVNAKTGTQTLINTQHPNLTKA